MVFRGFYAKRLLRIVPLMLVYLAFVLLWAAATRYQATALDVASILLCFKHVVGGAPLLIHFWSLSVEILFYIIWPLFLLQVNPTYRRRTALALVVLLPATTPLIEWMHASTPELYVSQYFRAEAILLGCWLALSQTVVSGAASPLRWIQRWPDACFGLALTAAMVAEWAKPRFPVDLEIALHFAQVAAAAVIVFASMKCRSALLRSVLDSSAARWLALISYGTYVWQQFFFFGNPNDWVDAWIPRPLLLWSFWFPCNVLLALTIGALSYYLIERPLYSWRERLAHRHLTPPSSYPTIPASRLSSDNVPAIVSASPATTAPAHQPVL